nr:MAG TPA: hypothetical protein [Caudoviricetes sp.]
MKHHKLNRRNHRENDPTMNKTKYVISLTVYAILTLGGILLTIAAFTQPPEYMCLPVGLLIILISLTGTIQTVKQHRMQEYTEWTRKNTQAETSSNTTTSDSTNSMNNSTESNESTPTSK